MRPLAPRLAPFLMIAAATTLIGCDDSDGLTAAELAAAENKHWWVLEVPPGHEDAIFGVQTVSKDGITRHGGGSGWSAGEVKVFLWATGDERLRYAVVGDSGDPLVQRGNIPSPFPDKTSVTTYVPVGEHIEPGQLVYAAGNETASIDRPLDGDEIAIAFGFEQKD